MSGKTIRSQRFYMHLPIDRSMRTMAMYLIISEIRLNGTLSWQL